MATPRGRADTGLSSLHAGAPTAASEMVFRTESIQEPAVVVVKKMVVVVVVNCFHVVVDNVVVVVVVRTRIACAIDPVRMHLLKQYRMSVSDKH
mmetsp:Transcript_53419/g.153257  ORF Transcript_53419/g.153257 Transcript_53419/m.153257 type:complete len:94 (-) Transcript_53419:640-921(-)